MKQFNYSCDGGCLAIKIGNSLCRINNRYGDGCFKVYEMNEEEFKQYKKDHIKYGIKESDYSYFSYWYLDNAEVLDYDYIRDYTETLFVLTGWYHIYILDGKVYFIFSNVQNYD